MRIYVFSSSRVNLILIFLLKEVRRLLRDTRVKISDSDGSDATIIKTDGDDSDSDSERKNRRAKSKR